MERRLTYATVKAWMDQTGRGFARAAEHFGVPEQQLRDLKASALSIRAGRKPGPGRGGAEPWQPAPDPEPAPEEDLDPEALDRLGVLLGAPLEVPILPDLDPVEAPTEGYLAHRLAFATGMVVAAIQAGSPNVARNWEIIAQRTRKSLDDHREHLRQAAAARGRDDLIDPPDIARRIMRRARELVNVAPKESEELLHFLANALGYTAAKRPTNDSEGNNGPSDQSTEDQPQDASDHLQGVPGG